MIHLDYSSSNPIYLQIKENIKKLILSGGLQENESLPSVRTLASTLAINVNTVIKYCLEVADLFFSFFPYALGKYSTSDLFFTRFCCSLKLVRNCTFTNFLL